MNRKWFSGIFKGKYSLFRVVQTVLVILLLITMIGSAVSGMILSKHVFGFLDLKGASSAREIHMLCGYWNFILMSLAMKPVSSPPFPLERIEEMTRLMGGDGELKW